MKNFYRDSGLTISIIALVILLLGLSFYVYSSSTHVFWMIAPFLVLISGFALGKLLTVTRKTFQYFAFIGSEIEKSDKDSLYNLPLSVAILDENSCVIWYNQNFKKNFSGIDYGNSLSTIYSGSVDTILANENVPILYKGKYFEVNAVRPERGEKDDGQVCIVYFNNVTTKVNLERELKLKAPVVLYIMIDGYDEMFDNTLESEKAHVTVRIDKLLEEFIGGTGGIMKKFNRDRAWAVMESRDVERIIEEKVKILDRAREIAVTERMSVTLSIGIGTTGKNLTESEQFAKQALEMAQGRGGDQAAVKTGNGFEFYGGVSKGIERHTKIKARIIANSLIELVEQSNAAYIMGHKYSDLDSIGSAVGLACGIRNLSKDAYVVIDKTASLGQELIDRVKDGGDEKRPLFIQPNKAREMFAENSLLIIVDTHSKQMVEDPELYQRAKKVVVIDHHRKTVNFIDNALIFHHEPYASSASEMVTELLQYFGNGGRLNAIQAEALLAGIMLDTKNFTLKAGVRTFEAAAFLRKLGADTVNVKPFFANSFENYRQKVMFVSSAKLYKKCAIASSDVVNDNMRLVAPQAADEMLEIVGVDAAFAIYRTGGNEIYISARSLGVVNVQIIMEYLGGGGHLTMAGAQIKDSTLADVVSRVAVAIDTYYSSLKQTS